MYIPITDTSAISLALLKYTPLRSPDALIRHVLTKGPPGYKQPPFGGCEFSEPPCQIVADSVLLGVPGLARDSLPAVDPARTRRSPSSTPKCRQCVCPKDLISVRVCFISEFLLIPISIRRSDDIKHFQRTPLPPSASSSSVGVQTAEDRC